MFVVRPGASRLKARIANSIGNALQRRVEIGSVHLRLLPRPGFDLENFVVHDDPAFGAEPVLRAGEVSASLRLSSLFRGRIEISQLSMTEPSLNLTRNADGRWNVETLLERTSMTTVAPTAKGAGAISAFVVEAGTTGLSLGKIDRKMGQKGAHTCDVIFDNCRVPVANLIGEKEGVGFKTAMKVLDKGRLHIAAVATGAAERMLADALRYAMERKQFGKPIVEFELIQAMLADSQAEIYASRCMIVDAARRRDAGERVASEASCAKMFATEMCGRVADRAVQIFGGAGYMSEYGIERFYRDVRLFRIYEGTTQIQQIVIAREMQRSFAG